MSDDDMDLGPFGFAFGEGAAEEFKERLKELMRAQKEAFDEMQAESGGQVAAVDRRRPAGDGAPGHARRRRRRHGPDVRPCAHGAAGGAPPEPVGPGP
jgi:hypothetical protein